MDFDGGTLSHSRVHTNSTYMVIFFTFNSLAGLYVTANNNHHRFINHHRYICSRFFFSLIRFFILPLNLLICYLYHSCWWELPLKPSKSLNFIWFLIPFILLCVFFIGFVFRPPLTNFIAWCIWTGRDCNFRITKSTTLTKRKTK